MIDFDTEQSIIHEYESSLRHYELLVTGEEKNLEEASEVLIRTQEARELLQLVAQAVQQKAHERIAGVVTSCLEAVFGDEAYEFKIEFERKRGRTEARLLFCRGGLQVDPLEASGGGVVDVAAFALRVACLMLHRPRLSRLIVLDEPFKFVSAEYRASIKSMLEKLSKDLGLQIILVTHINELQTGQVIEI